MHWRSCVSKCLFFCKTGTLYCLFSNKALIHTRIGSCQEMCFYFVSPQCTLVHGSEWDTEADTFDGPTSVPPGRSCASQSHPALPGTGWTSSTGQRGMCAPHDTPFSTQHKGGGVHCGENSTTPSANSITQNTICSITQLRVYYLHWGAPCLVYLLKHQINQTLQIINNKLRQQKYCFHKRQYSKGIQFYCIYCFKLLEDAVCRI